MSSRAPINNCRPSVDVAILPPNTAPAARLLAVIELMYCQYVVADTSISAPAGGIVLNSSNPESKELSLLKS